MTRKELIFRKYNYTDEPFVSYCKNMNSYKSFIGNSLTTDNHYIINYKVDIGLLEVYDINIEDSNLSINIFLLNDFVAISGLALFKAIEFIFSEYMIHKLILKVYDNNKKMISILNRFSIYCEGSILYDSKNQCFVNIYSILEEEYQSMKDISWRNVCGSSRCI